MKNYLFDNYIGIDEVGRGSWSGPVVACSLILGRNILKNNLFFEINDSKKISKKKRYFLSTFIKKNSNYNIGQSSSWEVDKFGILKSTELAMKRSFDPFKKLKYKVKIDGPQFFTLNQNSEFIVNGDQKFKAIAAASIVAKVFRDNLMEKLSTKFPEYGWENNFGYGTEYHKNALKKYGITPQHRITFKPIKKIYKDSIELEKK